MVTEAQIARINALAKKKKSGSALSADEIVEQQKLRALYLESIRENFRAQLETIEITDDGEDKSDELTHAK